MTSKKYFELEPECPGYPEKDWDDESNDQKPSIKVFIFNVWMGDEIVSIYPYYLATEELSEILKERGFTGFEVESVEVEKGKQFRALKPDLLLPRFVLLNVEGRADRIDMFDHANALVVSEEVLKVILMTKPHMLSYSEFREASKDT